MNYSSEGLGFDKSIYYVGRRLWQGDEMTTNARCQHACSTAFIRGTRVLEGTWLQRIVFAIRLRVGIRLRKFVFAIRLWEGIRLRGRIRLRRIRLRNSSSGVNLASGGNSASENSSSQFVFGKLPSQFVFGRNSASGGSLAPANSSSQFVFGLEFVFAVRLWN